MEPVNPYKHLKGRCEEQGNSGALSLHSGVLRQAQTETRELPSEYEENPLYCAGDADLEQAAQTG